MHVCLSKCYDSFIPRIFIGNIEQIYEFNQSRPLNKGSVCSRGRPIGYRTNATFLVTLSGTFPKRKEP